MKVTQAELIQVARAEIRAWGPKLPRGLALAILFAFIHRVTTGNTVEETFFKPAPADEPDYEI